MPTYIYTGTLADAGLEPLSGFQPVLTFRLSSESTAGRYLVVTKPVTATLFPDGTFFVELVSSDDLEGGPKYIARAEWLNPDGEGGHTSLDLFTFFALSGGGEIAGMRDDIHTFNPAQVFWQATEPVPWPVGWIWVNSGTGAVNRKVAMSNIEYLGNVNGDPGPQGERGPRGLDGVNAVSNDAAIAQAIRTPGTLTYAETRKCKVLTMGSSIGMGIGTTTPSTDAYPQRAEYWLESMLPGLDVQVVNASVSGDSTTDIRARLAERLEAVRPQYVTIEMSINDVALTKNVSTFQTIENIRAMVGMCRLYGAIPIILTHQIINPAQINNPALHTQATQDKAVSNRANLLAIQAELQGVQIVDIFALLRYQVGVSTDGIHPTTKGANQWGFAIAEQISRSINGVRESTYWTDLFERTSNTTPGGTWVPWNSSVWGTDGSSAYVVTGGDGSLMHSLVPAADVSFTVEFGWPSGVKDGGIMIRSSGGFDGYLANYLDTAGVVVVVLYAAFGGSVSEIARSGPLVMANGKQLTLTGTGNNFLVLHDGIPVTSGVSGSYPSGTRVGLRRSSNAAVRFGAAYARY